MAETSNINPWAQVATGVASTGGDILSTLITNAANKKENERTRDYNLKMWQMQNEYNTPEAQMLRYKAAGLNPNLIYGNGSSSSGNATAPSAASPVNYRAPSVDLPNVMAVFQQWQAIKNAESANKNMNWQTQKIAWETANEFEKYMANYLTNDVLFGDLHQNRKINYAEEHTPVWDIKNPESSPLFEQKFKAALQGQYLTNDLRSSESQMNEGLKDYYMTAKDPSWIRLIINAMDRFLPKGTVPRLLKRNE